MNNVLLSCALYAFPFAAFAIVVTSNCWINCVLLPGETALFLQTIFSVPTISQLHQYTANLPNIGLEESQEHKGNCNKGALHKRSARYITLASGSFRAVESGSNCGCLS
jgi:hypothetical protein